MIFKVLPHEDRSFLGIVNYGTTPKKEQEITERGVIAVVNSIATVTNLSLFIEELNLISWQNERIKNPVFHAMVSFSNEEEQDINDEKCLEIVDKYLEQMGYKDQPYMVSKHTDTDNLHYHIVTSRINRLSHKKIDHSFENLKSLEITNKLNQEYNFTYSRNRNNNEVNNIIVPRGQYEKLNEKVQNIFRDHNPINFLQFKKLCDQEQIVVTKTEKGYVFFPHGIKKGIFSSSLKIFKIFPLEKRLNKNRYRYKYNLSKVRTAINYALIRSIDLESYIQNLGTNGVNVIVSSNSAGINGLRYVYREFEFKGSDIGKMYSWNNINRLLEQQATKSTQNQHKPKQEENIIDRTPTTSSVIQQILLKIQNTSGAAAIIKKKKEEAEEQENTPEN